MTTIVSWTGLPLVTRANLARPHRRTSSDYCDLDIGHTVRDYVGYQWVSWGDFWKSESVPARRLTHQSFADEYPFTSDVPADLDLPSLCGEHLHARVRAQLAEDALNRRFHRLTAQTSPAISTKFDQLTVRQLAAAIEAAPFHVPCPNCKPPRISA